QRHLEAAQQALGAPIEMRPSTELGLDACKQAPRTEAAGFRGPDKRAAGLLPGQREQLVLDLPADREPSRPRRERAILRRVGEKLMQRQRQRLGGCRQQLNFGSSQFDLAAEGIWRKLLVDQLREFGALPARQ